MKCRVSIPDEFEDEIKALHKDFLDTYDDDIVPDDYKEQYHEYVFEHGSPELIKAFKKYLKDLEHDEDM